MPEIALLLGRGASPTDADANGRTVAAAVSSRWGRYELLARIRARLRTAEQPVSTELSHGRVTIDMRTREVHVGGRSVELSPREFTLLETLMHHAGQVMSQTQLLDQVWGYDRDPTSNVVEVYVGYLRKKLRRDVVETVRGAGYRFRG